MKYRKLRIAWSVSWAICCALLIVFWERSYSWCDNLAITRVGPVATSSYGRVRIPGAIGANSSARQLQMSRRGMLGGLVTVVSFDIRRLLQEEFSLVTRSRGMNAPYSALLLLAVLTGAAPWFHRFSLRTLLIATTLVAVVLGLIVWSSH
jgi:hypothetical protein